MTGFIYALLLTIVVEGIVMLALTRKWRWAYYNFLCNIVTNPLLNLAVMLIFRITQNYGVYYVCVAVGEVLVLVTEAELYHAMTDEKRGRCYLRSLVTNACSFGLGQLIM